MNWTTPSYTPDEVLKIAIKDVEDFLNSLPHHEPLYDFYTQAKAEVRCKDKVRLKGTNLSTFVYYYFNWLEAKRQVDFKERPDQLNFLKMLERWLGRFRSSKEKKKVDKIWRAPRIQQFARFVANKKLKPPHSFCVQSKCQARVDLWGFPTFLYLSPAMRSALVVYDEKKMESGRNKKVIENRYEMYFLHEAGHIRLHYDWIKSQQKTTGEKQVRVGPQLETDAWLYAYVVAGFVGGLQSRTKRLLGACDDVEL